MGIYRGVGGTGDSSIGQDVQGSNSTITDLIGLEGAIRTPTYIEFAENSGVTLTAKQVGWNQTEGTLDVGLNGGTVILQVGEETLYRVINQSGTNITNGELVCYDGTTGNSGKLKVTAWTGAQPANTILGLATDDINNGDVGFVTHFGKVRGIQTNGGKYSETWADGDILYASPTGGLTKVKPTAPDTKSTIAVVVNAHPSNGTLFVRPQLSSNLGDDDLVELSSLNNGDILQYNSTSGVFENVALPSAVIADGDKGDITVSGTGTTWTIDNDAVTYAKIQNVSATDRLLGRSTAGAGDIEEIVCTAAGRNLLDDADAAAQRTTLGATTIGSNVFTLTNPSSITFPRFNADNTVSALTASNFRTAIGAGTGNGTVTSVSWTGGIVSVANGTTTPAFTIDGTSGGIPYFSSGTTWATSAALAANALVVGGGAGNAPATVTTGSGVLTALGVAANGSGGFVTNTGSVTLTNKTVNLSSNTLSGTKAQFDIALSDDNFAYVGTANSFTAQQTFKELKDTVHTITDGAAFEIDPANGSIQVITLGANRTPVATNFEAGQVVLLGIDDGTAFTITWTTVAVTWVKAGGTASAPTLATTGFTWVLLWKVGSTVYGVEVGQP